MLCRNILRDLFIETSPLWPRYKSQSACLEVITFTSKRLWNVLFALQMTSDISVSNLYYSAVIGSTCNELGCRGSLPSNWWKSVT